MRLEKKMKTIHAPRSLELFFLFVRAPLVLLVMIVGAQAQSMVDDPPATDSARTAITTPATTTTPTTPSTPIATTTLATTITPVTKGAPVMMTPVAPVPVATPVPVCERTVKADVVALDQVIMYNRLGAVNPNGMIYALKQDIVAINASQGLVAGNVRLRSDKRPRPIVLRMNIGDCLKVSFTNLLSPSPSGDQPATRTAGVHAMGMELVGSISSDGSNVARGTSAPLPSEARTNGLTPPSRAELKTTCFPSGDHEGS